MKSNVIEYEGCFAIDLAAENAEETALLVRMGIDSTDEIRHKSSSISQKGKAEAHIVFAKHKCACDIIPKRISL